MRTSIARGLRLGVLSNLQVEIVLGILMRWEQGSTRGNSERGQRGGCGKHRPPPFAFKLFSAAHESYLCAAQARAGSRAKMGGVRPSNRNGKMFPKEVSGNPTPRAYLVPGPYPSETSIREVHQEYTAPGPDRSSPSFRPKPEGVKGGSELEAMPSIRNFHQNIPSEWSIKEDRSDPLFGSFHL